MDNKEVERVLEELYQVRPEKLNDKAKRLFEAIMTIANSRDKAEADLYEANNRINDLLDIEKQKDKIIDLLIKELYKKAHISKSCYLMTSVEECMKHKNCYECLKKYFEERCK